MFDRTIDLAHTVNYPFLVFSLVVWFNTFSLLSTTNYFLPDLKAHSEVQMNIFISVCVCVCGLQVRWEQEVTHRGIPRAVGFNLWTRMFRECESIIKRHVKTIRPDRLLGLHSLGGTIMALRFTISFVIRTSCSTWIPVVLVFFAPLCTDRLALSFKHRRWPAWAPVENSSIWPAVSSYELPLSYLFHSSVQLLGNECRRMETQLLYAISTNAPSRALHWEL